MTKKPIQFKTEIKGNRLARAGVISTPHGEIATPAFVVVGTKATVKALAPEQVRDLGAQTTLCNTYHLYLQPGDHLVAEAGGLHKFMNWDKPMFTDSGGFQVFSLGAAFGEGGVTKFAKEGTQNAQTMVAEEGAKLAQVDDDGVTFKSHIDGSKHRLTPEKSIAIQHNLGADIIFAFDECTSPQADYDYQKKAMERTHVWALRSLNYHEQSGKAGTQGLFGIVQGGKHRDLREESARVIGSMEGLAGFGIGGSFSKDDLGEALGWVNNILPEDKPRHLLGIGEPEDLFIGVENGIDTFDCVAPTRMARNGTLYTKTGKINIFNTQYKNDFTPIDSGCGCYTCQNYSRAYLSHLFRAKEMMAGTLASIHNLYFIVNLVSAIRSSLVAGTYEQLKKEYLG
ncbi:MAG: tRNA-guanine(34) transglycosylase [Candidatus Vogelbacteria bacterium RIFOXYD1_FULL_44_32]|uniref:Queuine tRNA-ribosyltransferase n=1 Tax=Candidatus Vogelbacteria bacterium RIFOXYD1_FULL_44_32 TaxID=1802438 RepID=A0A1G2QF29_9BACT|nr:MAG: tRNA-guanine(34) transglycosylase [Candidatus Vogelbacteria bacterium RIFOXYD1_FULL_44_32]